MSKNIKIVFKIIVLIVFCLIIIEIIYSIMITHTSDDVSWKQYMCFFDDSIKRDVDTVLNYSYVKERDVYNNFHYIPNSAGIDMSDKFIYHRKDTIYNVIIWEFKDLSNIKLDEIIIKPDVDLTNIKLESGEVINKNSDLEISIIQRFSFKKLGVELNTRSTLQKEIQGTNYKGFCGVVSKMSLINETSSAQIFFNFFPEKQTVLLFYKGHQSFFLIMINSDKTFDEEIIKILNLD